MPEIRRRICQDLGFLGVELDDGRNEANDAVISRRPGKVSVQVIPTNEQVMIARMTADVLEKATLNVKT
jgi:acetate kinase